MEKTKDRRVLRTRTMLLDAFLDLMIEKGYEAITIQDVIDRANIGRSTFYLHFADKENLLLCSIEQLREFIREQSRSRIASCGKGECKFGFSLAMLQHAQSHKRLYRAIVGKHGEAPVLRRMQQLLAELVRDEMAALFPHPSTDVPGELAIDFAVAAFLTVLAWWMEQNMPCPAAAADAMFHKLALAGLGGLSKA